MRRTAVALAFCALVNEGCVSGLDRRTSGQSNRPSRPSSPPPVKVHTNYVWEGRGPRYIGQLGSVAHAYLLSPSGRFLACAGNDVIDVIDLRQRKALRRIAAGSGPAGLLLFFSPDEKLLGHAHETRLQVFEVATGKSVFRTELPRAPEEALFSADGAAVEVYLLREDVVGASRDGPRNEIRPAEKREIEVATGKVRASGAFQAIPPTPAWWSRDQRVSRDGRARLSTQGDTLMLVDRVSGAVLQKLGPGRTEHSAIDPEGLRVATADGVTMTVYDARTAAVLAQRRWGMCTRDFAVRFTPSGHHLLTWCNVRRRMWKGLELEENDFNLRDSTTLEVVENLVQDEFWKSVRFVTPAFMPDGSAVYFQSKSDKIFRVDQSLARHESASKEYQKLLGEAASMANADAAEKAYRAAIVLRPGRREAHLGLARLYLGAGRKAELETAYAAAQKLGAKDEAIEAAFAELRQSSLPRDLTPRPAIFSGSVDRPFLVLEQGRHTARVSRVLYTPDGRAIVTASWDKTIRVWDAKTFQLLRTLRVPAQPGNEGQIFAMALSPDQRFVAAAGYSVGAGDPKQYKGDYVALLDFQTGKLLDVAYSHRQSVLALAFSRDGKKLASGGGIGDHRTVVHQVAASGKLLPAWSIRLASKITDLAFDPDHERLYTAEFGGAIGRALPPAQGRPPNAEPVAVNPIVRMMQMTRRKCPDDKCAFYALALSPDGSMLAGGMASGGVGIYDPNGKPDALRSLAVPGDGPIGSLGYSRDGRRLAVARGKQVFVLDAREPKEEQKPLATFSGHDNTVFSAAFSPDGARIVSSSANHVFVWDASIGEQIAQIGGASTPNRIWSLAAGKEGPRMIGFGWRSDGQEKMNRYGKVHKAFDLSQLRVVSVADPAGFLPPAEGADPDFRPGIGIGAVKSWARLADQSLLLGTEFGVYRRPKGSTRLDELSHEGIAAYAVAVSADGQTMYAGLVDGRVQIFDTASGKPIGTLYVAPDEEWILWTPEGWYAASRNGARSVGWQVGASPLETPRFYPFEQFDLRLNRPDHVLARLGGASKRRLDAIAASVARRWKRTGLSEAALGSAIRAPSLQLGNVPPTTRKKKVKLSIEAHDEAYPLSRVNVWINDVPLFGAAGAAVEGTELKRTVEVELTAGRNKIQASVLNGAGIESLKETRYATYAGKSPKGTLHVLAVGVSDYAAEPFKLRYAAKDAGDLAALAAVHGKGPFRKVLVHRLVDGEATRERILAAKEKLRASRVDDEVIVFFAGHGLLDEKLDYWFATADMDFEKPAARGLLYDDIEGLLDGIPARRKLLLVDTCHSGEVDKDSVEVVALAGETRGPAVKARAVGTRGIKKKLQGAEAAVQGLGDAIGELFQDLRRGSGAMVISAAGGAEYALESSEWNNGVFTYAVLDGLGNKSADRNGDGRVQISELRDHVAEVVKRLTAGKQTPTVRRENLEFDFPVF